MTEKALDVTQAIGFENWFCFCPNECIGANYLNVMQFHHFFCEWGWLCLPTAPLGGGIQRLPARGLCPAAVMEAVVSTELWAFPGGTSSALVRQQGLGHHCRQLIMR